MSDPKAQVAPKHAYYVSLDNDCIYPAMSSPAGYEDEHPGEYRPANPSEIERYKGGAETTHVEVEPISLTAAAAAAAEVAVPTTLKLAEEAPLAPEAPRAILPPAAPAAIPPAPGALNPIG